MGPSQTKVFDLTCVPREAGEARVASITMLIEEEAPASIPILAHSPTGHALLGLLPPERFTLFWFSDRSQTKVFDLTCVPREAGEARVASITMLIEEEQFDLGYAIVRSAIPTNAVSPPAGD
jgi:hypothetical protein